EDGDGQLGEGGRILGADPPEGDPGQPVGLGQPGPYAEAAGVLVPDGAAVGRVDLPFLFEVVPAGGGAGGGGEVVGGGGGDVGRRRRARGPARGSRGGPTVAAARSRAPRRPSRAGPSPRSGRR